MSVTLISYNTASAIYALTTKERTILMISTANSSDKTFVNYYVITASASVIESF